MMRRVTFAAATAAPILSRSFSSNFSDDVGTYKRPVKYSSRSGAHRHVTTATPGEARRASRGPYAANNGTKPSSHVSGEADDVLLEDASFPDASEAASMPRNVKNSYSHLFKKKPERISFSTRFSSATDEAPANTEELEEADVTRIYSGEELQSMGNDQQEAEHSADRHAAPLHRPTAYSGTEDEAELTEAAEVEEGEEDPFAQIRRQPFFQEVLNRVERNIARYRKEISGTRRYSASAINDCIRPLLQLADYPFTGTQLSQLANVVNPIILKSSLGDLRSCQKLHIYRSPDTEVVLDWSVEDFLRRRYESIHVSWEPLDVVIRRYGWSNDVVSPRDCLIFFGAFKDHVELAEMVLPPNEKMTAEPIEDAVDRANSGSIPLSRLLIRRKCSAETEPSLTESVRLMGTPALHTTIQGRRSRQQLNSEESVSGMFAAVEQAAQEVDADDETKYRHGMESVSSLRQATHPNGRVIKEFSVGKRIQQRGMADRKVHRDEEDKHNDQTQVKQSDMQSDVTVDEFEKASSAYHKAKVEVSLLRRRLLNTENVDLAAELQEKLADSRRELTRLSELVRRLRSTQLVTREQQSKGFNVPKEQPNYPEAPEHPTTDTKNYQAAEEDSDIDISQYVEETSTELHGVKAAPTKTQTKLEEIELKIEEISSAAEDARVALHKLVEVQRVQEQTMKRKLAAAEDHVRQLEGELQNAEEEKKAEEASILRANMEAEKQRAMEELAVQREAARRAQEEAAQALARQRQAEEEALLLESRLRKKLEDMMEVESAAPTSPSLTAKEGNNSRENLVSEPPRTSAPDRTLSTPPPNDNKEISGGNFFMCTPEQYNGLHLAAGRLRKEITALEGQMEQEGDEDDETLMAALAASRADLEELDECISSVQSGASWAAEQDAKRQHANKQSLLVEDTDAQRVQDEIDQQRFAISLFEKRIQHTSQRSVIAKLEQRIVQARREISRLRIEQDRLRRAGRDTFGLPPSVSMAETLAHEGADNDETGDTPHAGEENGREGDIAAEADSDFDGSPVSQMEAEGDSITGEGASGEGTPSRDGLSTQGTILEAAHAAIGDASEGEARLLRSRLDRMVQSIQQLQEDIVHQERSSDYDDEEAENVLQAMKEKLQVLLKLRDDVERRLPKSATIAHSRSPLMTTAPTPQPLSVLPLKSSVRLTPAAKRLRMMANVRKMKSK